jgi:FAD/FMN-containing dehydrogenase
VFVHRFAALCTLRHLRLSPAMPDDLAAKEACQTWIRGLYNGMLQHYDGGCYQGYWDPDVEDWGDAYYGENFHQLRVVKSAYDPQNVFQFQRSIPPI